MNRSDRIIMNPAQAKAVARELATVAKNRHADVSVTLVQEDLELLSNGDWSPIAGWVFITLAGPSLEGGHIVMRRIDRDGKERTQEEIFDLMHEEV